MNTAFLVIDKETRKVVAACEDLDAADTLQTYYGHDGHAIGCGSSNNVGETLTPQTLVAVMLSPILA